ncbi:HAD family hydrolase [Salinigranum rubrum]|uniref:HAD family hydrolase n=1 Tax=Salinigranum rubrum TaxID=755307 RepID=A0A2I8VFW9_9EURY|nr:HAD hydrolase family protein [Salinigranum rubrum]AUV80828.1 HAD family hydrolase [Salinigranum rubrum]
MAWPLNRLYATVDTDCLRRRQTAVDCIAMGLSDPALQPDTDLEARLAEQRERVEDEFGPRLAEVAAYASHEQARHATELAETHGRAVNALVLDLDETLRSVGTTDDRVPVAVIALLGQFVDADVPVVICTGQTMENVKGLLVQGLGSDRFHSGAVSVVYEAGIGVFTPKHGVETKQELYRNLDEETRTVFETVRTAMSTDAPRAVREGAYLQGNEFNVTLKPNAETGSEEAVSVIDHATVAVLDRVGEAVAGPDGAQYARAYYADRDPEIRDVVDRVDALPELDAESLDDDVHRQFERIDVLYYHGSAAEVGSPELSKAVGAQRALSTLGVDDPFVLAMGDSLSDRRLMEWVTETDSGLVAGPTHASEVVCEFLKSEGGLFFEPGRAVDVLRTTYAMNVFATDQRSDP